MPVEATGAVQGVVSDDNRQPLAGVTVIASRDVETHTTLTDQAGHYRLAGLSPGTYVVQFFAGNINVERRNIAITAGRDTPVYQRLGSPFLGVGGDFCVSDEECPGWQVCSAGRGDCGNAMGSSEVCTGVCREGGLGLSARAGAVLDGDADDSAALGLEVMPPELDGRLSLAADWWTDGAWRLPP